MSNIVSHTIFSVLFLAGFLLPNTAAIANKEALPWVTAEGSAPILDGDITSAKVLALQRARQHAVRKSMCQDLSTEALMVHLRLSGSLAGSIPHCKIIKSKILEDGPDRFSAGANSKPILPTYQSKIQAAVVDAGTKPDAKFRLDAQLNQIRFQEGEEMVVRIAATKPSYCYIYVILEDNHVIQLMPHRFGPQKILRAGQSLMFPDAGEINTGIRLKTQLPAGQNVTTEMVYIVALKATTNRPSRLSEHPILGLSEAKIGRFDQLVAMITAIPANQRCEMILPYQIVERTN